MAVTKPLDVCVDKSLGKSMLLTLWSSDLTPDGSTSLPLQVRLCWDNCWDYLV